MCDKCVVVVVVDTSFANFIIPRISHTDCSIVCDKFVVVVVDTSFADFIIPFDRDTTYTFLTRIPLYDFN